MVATEGMVSGGIVQLKFGGVIYQTPWSQHVLFQHTDENGILGFEVIKHSSSDRYIDRQAYRILYGDREAYIMEWDAGEFFERPKLPKPSVDS